MIGEVIIYGLSSQRQAFYDCYDLMRTYTSLRCFLAV
jgi:hypothetical protein